MRIELDDVTVTLGATTIIDGLSAEIASGRVTALAGPSGSGKTTLLASLAGEVPIASGQVRFVGDHDRRDFAWIPQAPNVLGHRTVMDNVMVGSLARGHTLEAAADQAQRHLHAVGLAHRAYHAAEQLSGGEQQRLAFARALAVQASLILADEPTANLDAANTERICDMLSTLSGTSTIVVATHDARVMGACDDVLHLREDGP